MAQVLSFDEASQKIYEIAKSHSPKNCKRLPKEQWLKMLEYASYTEPLTSSLTHEEMLEHVWLKLDSLGYYDRNSIPKDHDPTILYNATKLGYILAMYEDLHPVDLLVFGYFCRNLGDLVNAEAYYRLAVKKGNVDALIGLSTLIEDVNLQREYLHQAIDKGMIRAYSGLGFTYEKSGDMVEALKMWKTGADNGDVSCMYEIGAVTRQEKFSDIYNVELADMYLNLAVEHNHPFSLLLKGSLLIDEGKEDEGWNYVGRAAELGNSMAMYYLVHYFCSLNNLDKAKEWMNRLENKKDHMTKRLYQDGLKVTTLSNDDRELFVKAMDSLPDTRLGIYMI